MYPFFVVNGVNVGSVIVDNTSATQVPYCCGSLLATADKQAMPAGVVTVFITDEPTLAIAFIKLLGPKAVSANVMEEMSDANGDKMSAV